MKTIKFYKTKLAVILLAFAISFPTLAKNRKAFPSDTVFALQDDAYIDDIPFNTFNISVEAMYKLAFSKTFTLPDETYINDIPFDTQKIAAEYRYNEAIKKTFYLEDEGYIDDIPFDTAEVIKNLNTLFSDYESAQ